MQQPKLKRIKMMKDNKEWKREWKKSSKNQSKSKTKKLYFFIV